MAYINDAARQVPVITETDVLVVGSGPGGLAAAISSARAGVDTMLVERFGCLGGNLTIVGVEGIAWYRKEGTIDVEGIGIEFEQRAKVIGATSPEPQSKSEAINAEMFKYVADVMVQEAGVIPLLHSVVIDTIIEDSIIKGVIIHNKSGRQAILAKRVIDATGDADLAFFSGAPYKKTPKEEMLSVTVMFSVSGVNRKRFLEYVKGNPTTYKDWGKNWDMQTDGKEDDLFSPYLEHPFNQARELGVIPKGLTSIGGTWSTITDYGEATYLNMIHMTNYDGTDVWDLTKAEIDGRYQALQAIKALRHFAPGFEEAELRNYGMTVGIRDTRKIIGWYELTEHDVKNQARFEDSIGIFPEFIDGYGVLILPTTGRYYQVPFGILVPKNVENLLIAGRCVAGDKISHASVRNMMCCTVTGQGAGVAAAVSVKDGVKTSEVKINHLQKALEKQGVRIK
ncbi:MAG: pyridine nucleotide-disulfide oxidoreductase [Anaerolineales bacterium]|nr:FAD-dependent oxidoreductase [Anaerolineae bacterium]PWB50478.1 MAG: pyridine nucleotide-disulfide oxidoreductase [Anaerolineales bacterium]